MSGHSKWSRIKRKKEVADSKRGAEFTKLATVIKQQAKNNPNPATNSQLAEAIRQAKQANMPQDNIDRLLSKSDRRTEEIVYEAFGPNGSALVINVSTDNTRRTVAELRVILKKYGGSLSEPGSVMWKFEPTPQGAFKTKYPQQFSTDIVTKIKELVDELDQNDDVEQVVSDTT